MSQKLTRQQSVIVLSIIEALERFSYYGMRSIAVLYVMNDGYFGIPQEEAFTFYTYITSIILFIALPIGLLSDFVFKQTKAVQIGSIIAIVGYAFLLISSKILFLIGVILIIIGSSFYSINLKVLLGRLYPKEDQGRSVGFITFFFAVNLSSFIAVMVVGYFAEQVGYFLGFLITLIAMIGSALLFYYSKSLFDWEELKDTSDEVQNSRLSITESNTILDDTFITEPTSLFSEKTYQLHKIPIAITLLLMSLFWIFYSKISIGFFADNLESFDFLGFVLPMKFASSLFTIMPFLLGGFLILIGRVYDLGSTLYKFSGSFLILSFISLLIYILSNSQSNNQLNGAFLLFGALLLGFAEIGITAFAYAYLTRLSNIKYASTVMGLAILMISLLPQVVNFLINLVGIELYFANILFIAGGIGLLLLIFKKKIQELAGGLD